MKDTPLNGTAYKTVAKTTQALSERLELLQGSDLVESNIAKVLAVYSETMTCDIETSNGGIQSNVPMLANCGLEDEEVWGEVELPSIGQYVIIDFIGRRMSLPYIIGTFYPYSNSKYQSGQTPVNSASKQFTLKLLEAGKPKTYKKIFKSGTSIEVGEDGTITLETPKGTYIKIDEAAETSHYEDAHGNKINIASTGINLEDANGNIIDMGSSSVMINNNLEILQ